MRQIYLDHAATTPVDAQAVKAMQPYFRVRFGNPSALYKIGQEAKEAMEKARAQVAKIVGARAEEIIFTSGGTEADNLAIFGVAYINERQGNHINGKQGNHIITSAIEHHAVLESLHFLEKRGFEVTYLPVSKDGLVDPSNVKEAITNRTILISVMTANNETGTIQPIKEIGRIAREYQIYFHTDAVQAVGAIPIDVNGLKVDLLSMSSHKLYGPKGIGALYVREGVRIEPCLHGGGQEDKRRSGTENVPGIVGFGEAVSLAKKKMAKETKRQIGLRNTLMRGLLERIEGVYLNGHSTKRLPNNVNVCVEFVEGESLLLQLDAQGICASSGSACSSASSEPSHVLLALGVLPEVAHGSLRLTLGRKTTEEEIDYVLEVLPKIVERLRAISPLATV